MCMSVLPTCMYVCRVHAEASRGSQTKAGVTHTQLYIVTWVLGLEPDSLKEQFLVITESLQCANRITAKRRFFQAMIISETG